MTGMIVSSNGPVLLIGGGAVDNAQFSILLTQCDQLVAADGGADKALAMGAVPDHVIGDLDSLSPQARRALPPGRIHQVAEQDSTDFEKCLTHLRAPLIHCLGFTGGRLDHCLAVLTTLTRLRACHCLLWDSEDIIALAPPRLSLMLGAGCRVSLYPMAQVTGTSRGLHWPIDGLVFEPAGQIGTSNRAVTDRVELGFDCPGMLILLPVEKATAMQRALSSAPGWPDVPAP